MVGKSSFEENYEQVMTPMVSKLNESRWENSRVTTLGAAGLSAAIVFLLMQTGVQTLILQVSFFCASLSVPVWLTLWQYGEAYSLYGINSYGHFAKTKGSGIGVLLFIVGGLLLLISFATLIWSISIFTSIAFSIVSTLMIVLTYRHSNAVREFAEANNSIESDF
jgi:hypothetical protein